MADEDQPIAESAPVEAAPTEPVPEAVSVETAPAAEPIAEPVPESASEKPEPLPGDEPPVEEAKPEPEKPESLLGKKPEETAEQVEEAVAEEPTPPEPPDPLAYEAFTFPEDAAPDESKLAQFAEIVGQYQVPQEAAQSLVDLYIADQRELMTRLSEHQHEVWRQTNEDWIDAVKKDREIGGNRLETVLTNAASVIDRFASTSRDAATRVSAQTQLRDALNVTGAGNHPAVVRFLANVAEALAAPAPLAAPRPMPAQSQSKATRRYSNGHANA